eukprot:1145836-Pelagomonas_calceolata.AAC.9
MLHTSLSGATLLAPCVSSLPNSRLLHAAHIPVPPQENEYKGEFTPPDIEETVSAMGELIKEGKIKHWGLSNETAYGKLVIRGREPCKVINKSKNEQIDRINDRISKPVRRVSRVRRR